MNARLAPDELRRRRLELGLTRRELARRAAVDLSVIEDAEAHGIGIYAHTASLLAGGARHRHQPRPAAPKQVPQRRRSARSGARRPRRADRDADDRRRACLPPERVRAAAAQLRHELQRLGQTVTLSPSDELGLAPFATCISDEQRAAVHREALTIDHATAELLLAVLRGRRDERSWNKLDDTQRDIAMQLVAAGAITEEHGMLAPSDQLAYAFEPGQLFGLDW